MFNQFKSVQGEIEREDDTIFYSMSWVRSVPADVVQMNEIEQVKIIGSDGEEHAEYYREHQNEIDDLIVEDASSHEPTDWEQPSYSDYKECQLEV